jgi:taurine dioxygenase
LVLFFPDQHLTPDEHVALARRFGECEIHPFLPKLDDDHAEIIVLRGEKGGRADVFHTDVTFSPTPPLCSVLHAKVMPPVGGDTIFTNQYRVYEELSEPMRDMLDGLTAVHTALAFGHPEQHTEHPVVRVHPETGRRSLYVNRQFTSHIPQLTRGESDALLSYLYSWSEQPQFQVRYRWSEGTVAIWDNRCTQHYAINDYPAQEPRRIERVTVLGDTPSGRTGRYDHYRPRGYSAATSTYYMGPGSDRETFAAPIDARQNSLK